MKVKIQTWFVYMIQTESGKLYTGITNDLNRRLNDHKTRRRGARFFYFSAPEKVVLCEHYATRSQALKRECEIKKMSRQAKLQLIQSKKHV